MRISNAKRLSATGECVGLLDGVVFLPSRELSTDEEARGKVDLALEGVRVEVVSEGGCRHRYSRLGVLTARSSMNHPKLSPLSISLGMLGRKLPSYPPMSWDAGETM